MPASAPDRLPVSSYRLQLRSDLTLAEAAALVPYLDCLGVTECYTSPILAAAPGTEHGYDVCDHSCVNPELGGEEGLAVLASALKERNMGWILDFVPNHMGIDLRVNRWWRDVLENGPSSPYARYFDIDWKPLKDELRGKLLLPILGEPYGVALDSGHLRISFSDGRFRLHYFDRDLPLNPRHMGILLRQGLETVEADLPADDPHRSEFLSVLFHFDHLPASTKSDPVSIAERQREKEVAKRRLAKLAEDSPQVRRVLENIAEKFNGTPDAPASFDLLHELLDGQAYRLSFWRTAMHEVNYRRFFDINELAGIRMEDPEVFEATHKVLVRLIGGGVVTGLRLDHVDGLFDPPEYFRRLQARCCGPGREAWGIFVVVEKILSEGEVLRQDWAVHGTTGYDFLNNVNSLFVAAANVQEFRKLYTYVAGFKRSFSEVAYASKKLIIQTAMAAELNVLAHELNRISESDRHYRDFTLNSLQAALTEVVACFPVYRTYFNAAGWDEFDQRNVDSAVRNALRRNPALEPSIFYFIRQMLLPVRRAGLSEEEFGRRALFAMKFQQYTGPVQAKGVEDTAFFRHGPLLSLNEVGGDPGRFGRPVEEFHQANQDRLHTHPLSVLATSTHDTKLGEDARARLNLLSEIPKGWREMVTRWARVNSSARTDVQGNPAPDRSDEYLYYQALLAAWPNEEGAEPSADFVQRMRQYMNKATKEKKVYTSWINPSAEYDEAVSNFVERTLVGTRSGPFLAQFLPFQKNVARLGAINSLAQLVLKIASPGVPDFYQGTELWDLSLTDPDNRRPVDFNLRARYLEAKPEMRDLLSGWRDGRIKQYLTAAGLRLRRANPHLFLQGEYVPVPVTGERKEHLVAFARRHSGAIVIAIVPRLVATLVGLEGPWPLGQDVWGDTVVEMPQAAWRNVFTGEEASTGQVSDILRTCPVALLQSHLG